MNDAAILQTFHIIAFIITLTILLYFIYLERRARTRFKKLKEIDQFILKPIKPEKIKYAEFLGVPAGATGVSIYEVYAATENHEVALNALKERHNLILSDVDHPFEWMNYLVEKTVAGEDTVNRVINNIKGQLGEEQAVEFLNSLPALEERGITAHLYENRSNPDNDLYFMDEDGNIVNPSIEFFNNSEVSVKTFGDVNNFMQEVKKSSADHYLVNSELYEKLDETGKLQELNEQGITVMDGQWKLEEVESQGRNAINDFEEAADISEDVPGVAILFLGYRTFGNTKNWYHGKITKEEFGVDFLVDSARAGTAGVGGFLGAKAGATVGSFIAPGVGTFIGGGIGVVAGAISSSKVFLKFKNWLKYSTIKDCLLKLTPHFREEYMSELSEEKIRVLSEMGDKYFGLSRAKSTLEYEKNLCKMYSSETNLYASEKDYVQPTIMGALVRNHTNELQDHFNSAKTSCQDMFSNLWDYCMKYTRKKTENARLLFASILVDFNITRPTNSQYVDIYLSQLKKYPNHPYRLHGTDGPIHGEKVVEYVLAEAYSNNSINKEGIKGKYNIIIGVGILLLTLFAFKIIEGLIFTPI